MRNTLDNRLKKRIAKYISGTIAGKMIKNYQCLSCTEIVQVYTTFHQIIKYFNASTCPYYDTNIC